MTTVEPRPAELTPAGRRAGWAVEEEIRRYQRSPRDLLRLIAYGVVALVLIALTVWLDDSILGFERDLVALFDLVTPTVERVLYGVLEWLGLVLVVGIFLVPLVTKRYRLFLYILLADLVSFGLMMLVVRFIDREELPVIVNELAARAGVTSSTSSSEVGFAQLTAAFVVLGPFVSAHWRRAGLTLIGLFIVARLLVAYKLPANVFVAIPVGATVGAGVLAALGRPDRRPTTRAVHRALVEAGLPVGGVTPAKVDARGSTPYFAPLDGGGRLFVKVLGENQRAADLMFRLYRFLRLKDVGDDRPFSSLRRSVEHEALVSLVARDVGVETPRMRAVAKVGLDSMLLAYDAVEGRSMDAVEPADVSDDLMRNLFRQVALLRRHRIAHRDLRLANVIAGHDSDVWMIDFGFAELAVDQGLLDADVAQLLASLSVVAGPERPVRLAIEVLGRDVVGECLPRLQTQALSGATQSALRHRKGLLAELQHEVQKQAGVAQVHFAELERIDRKTALMVLVVVAATYFLLPQFADLPGIVRQVREANWGWLPLVVAMSCLTYLGAATSLAGAVPNRLRAGPLLVSQVASSFASKLAPAGVGGMALNVRFLQKQGVDQPVSVSGVGLSTVGGVIVHLSMIGVFVIWAGRKAFGSLRLPDFHWFAVGLGVAVALVALGLAIPVTRRFLAQRLWPLLRRGFGGLSEVLQRPGKLGLLFGGSVVLTFSYLLALYFSIAAFGGGLPLATVGAVYLVGAAVASVAPTPGGLGAMEAALISGLVAAGLPRDIAVPAVFLYRLATFWLPILPGWLCFTWLQRTDHL